MIYELILLLITPLITALCVSFGDQFNKVFKEYIDDISHFIFGKLGYSYITLTYAYCNYSKVYTPSIENKLYCDSIISYINENIEVINNRIEINNNKINYFPKSKVYINNIYISINYDINNSTEVNNISIELKSKLLSKNQIIEFIKECYNKYELIQNISNNSNYYLINDIHRNDIRFSKYPFISNMNFNNYFSDVNDEIKLLLDNHINYKNKLTFMLYGIPGGGKTSLIKCIINYTKFEVINIKLSKIEDIQQLYDIYFNEKINIKDNKDTNLDLNKRIYIFEDIDCDSGLILNREDQKNTNNTTENNININVSNNKDGDNLNFKSNNSNKITLSDILNLFDGIIELPNCIIIFTTNYIDKIDPALKRAGRITKFIELGHMSQKSINEMISSFFPNNKINLIKDLMITPAKLENLCKLNLTNPNKFIDELQLYYCNSRKISFENI